MVDINMSFVSNTSLHVFLMTTDNEPTIVMLQRREQFCGYFNCNCFEML